MSFVMKSFWAMAHGLHNMLEEVCGKNFFGLCKEIHPFNGTLFKVTTGIKLKKIYILTIFNYLSCKNTDAFDECDVLMGWRGRGV